MNFLKKDLKLRYYFIIGALIGAVSFLLLYGYRVLDVTYDNWLLTGQDLQQHYLGWKFFRKAAWSFPLGMQNYVTFPSYLSVLYTDSIPLFAIPCKILSPILPSTFQYFGIFGIMCFMLNGGFASLVIAKISKSKIVSFGGSLFFVFATPVLQRMYGLLTESSRHTALAAHFLILAAIALWVYGDYFKSRKKAAIAWSALGVLCVLIQMYIIFMVGGIMCGYLLQQILKDKDWKRCFLVLGSFGVSALLVMYLVGGFSSGVPAGMVGFGIYSSNLNSLINPFNYSRFFDGLPMYSGQYEGFAYLGLGMILLCAICFVIALIKSIRLIRKHEFKKRVKALYRKHRVILIPLIIVMVVFFLLALSNQVYVGMSFVIGVSFPAKIMELLGVFRSSGRFMWCVMYFVMFFALYFICRYRKKTVAVIVVSACVVLQIADLSGVFREIHSTYANQVTDEQVCESVSDPFWNNIPSKYKKVAFYPLVGYVKYTVESYLDIGAKASNYDLKLNYFYLSRPYSEKEMKKRNKEITQMFKTGNLEDDILYVINYEMAHKYLGKANMYNVNNRVIATKEPLANVQPYQDMYVSEANPVVEFSVTKNGAGKYLLAGEWNDMEDEYSWTKDKSRLRIYSDQAEKVHVRIEYKQGEKSSLTTFYFDGKKITTIPKNSGNGVVEFDANIKDIRGKLEKEGDTNWLTIYTKKPTKTVVNKEKLDYGIAIGKVTVTYGK